MAQVLVRNLDDSIVAALKARAAAHGRSLEQELRLVLAEAARPMRQEVRKIAASIRALTRRPLAADLEALIREDRER
jgi:plasmid stability protein